MIKKLFFLSVFTLLLHSGNQVQAQCVENVAPTGSNPWNSSLNYIAQSFKASCNGEIDYIRFQNLTGAAKIEIRSGSSPTGGSILYTVNNPSVDATSNIGEHTLTTPLSVANTNEYIIVLSAYTTGSSLRGCNSNCYVDGKPYYSTNSGSTWIDYSFAWDYRCIVNVAIPIPPCSISVLTAGDQTACSSNTYTQEVTVTYANYTGAGTLDVNGQSFTIGTSPQTVTLTGLIANSQDVDVTASFSDDVGCTLTETALFTAPNSCAASTALHFLGAGAGQLDRINGSSASLPAGALPRTVEMWIKAEYASFPTNPFLFKYGSFSSNELARFSIINSDYSGTANGKIFFDSYGVNVISNARIMDSKWHHIAYVYDGASTVTLYVDGNLDISSSAFSSLNTVGTAFLINEGDYNSHSWTGTLDNVKVWNKALTLSEINSSKNNCLGANDPNLVLFYNFEDGIPEGDNTGAIANNVASTGAALNGTLNGFGIAQGSTTSNFVTGQTFDEAGTCGPIMAFSGNTQSIVNGATPELANHTSFGNLASGGSLVRTFTISNSGIEDITLSSSPAVAISGSSDFTVSTQPSITIAPGASTTFEVTFTPTASGSQTAELSIASNNPSSPFTFEVGGKTNTALNFDGTNGHVNIGDIPEADFGSGDFTIEFWVNPATYSTLATPIISKREFCTPSNFWDILISTSNNIQVEFSGSTSSSDYMSFESNVTIPTNSWTHVAVIKQGTTVTLYMDGTIRGSGTFASNLNNTGLLRLGMDECSLSSFARYFEGALDEVRIWNRALCLAEMEGRRNTSLQGNENGLGAYYDFEEGVAGADNTALPNTVYDKANNNHGTMNGFEKNNATSNWVDGKALKAAENTNTVLNFDGTGDYATLGFVLPATYTKEAWVKITGDGNILSGATSNDHVFWINGGVLAAGQGGNIAVVSDPDAFPVDTWIHVAVTYDSDPLSQEMILYKNGVAISTDIISNYTGTTTYLGAYGGATVFSGSMDEVRVWSSVRTPAELQANMNNRLIGTETDLVAYYDFEDGVADDDNTALTTITSKTGSNDGTLSGFAKIGSTSNWVHDDEISENGPFASATVITWQGDEAGDESNWNNADNWDLGYVPSFCNDVIIPNTGNNPTFADNQAVNSIEVQGAAALTVGAGGCLWVGSAFTNNGDFVLEASASAYAQYLGPQVKGTLSQVIGAAGWHNISSPFVDAVLGDIEFSNDGMLQFDAADKCNINYYNSDTYQATQTGWTTAWGSWECASGLDEAFDGSKAYTLFLDQAFASSFPVTMTVTGTLRNMPLKQELKKSNGGWNQLSNPFPSIIDFDKLYDNSEMGSSYRLWDATANGGIGEYYTYMVGGTSVPANATTRYVAPYQGVFVKTANSATVDPGSGEALGTQSHSISNADRPTTCPSTINPFYKTNLTGNLYIEATSGTLSNQLVIRFDNSFSEGYVLEEEAEKFFSTNASVPSIYTIVEDHAYVISSYPEPELRVQGIPIGLNTTAKNITLEAIEVPEGMMVFLEDKQQEVFHNLENPYVFTNVEEETGRFKLHVGGENSNITSLLGGDQIVFTQNESLVFYDSENLLGGKLLLINIAGQELLKGTVTAGLQIDVSGYAPGIYVIQVNNRGTVKTQRIVVR